MAGGLHKTGVAALLLLFLARPMAGQKHWGELSSTLTGTVSPSYNATYGNQTQSTHGWLMGGSANYAGSFHDPNFLSFTGNVYLNQSRSNSNYQSISNASGVNIATTLFAGSYFPGNISYSHAYNSEGNYSIPGAANYVTHGNSDALGITWSENLPDKPSLSASFQEGNSSYTVYGANNDGSNAFHSFNVHSSYKMDGFNMGAFYLTGGSHALIPREVTGEATRTHSSDDGFGFNFMHPLPLKGAASASFTRSSWDSSYLGYRSNGTVNLLDGLVSVHPWMPFSLTGTFSYSDNLSGELYQQYASGGAVPGINTNESSNSMDMMLTAAYNPTANLQTTMFTERRSQEYYGDHYGVTSFGGGASYSRLLPVGALSATIVASDNYTDKSGENSLGFSAVSNYSGVVKNWHLSSSFGYSQNVQTLIATYMNSTYHFTGTARRNWGNFDVSASTGLSRTALAENRGTSSGSDSYEATVGYSKYFNASGSYAKAYGQGLATGGGIVPIVPPLVPSNLILFGGDSYAVGVSSTPARRLIMSATWSKAFSHTSNFNSNSNLVKTSNQNEQFNAILQYQFRKTMFNSGFARLRQGFSTGGQPEVISSYSVGVSRWFNVF